MVHWREVRNALTGCTGCKSGECSDVRVRDALAGRQDGALTGEPGMRWLDALAVSQESALA